MEARATKAPRVLARFSKSLARRRLRPNQEKVRSTTQRRGRATKPFMLLLRLTISVRSGGTFATATQPARRYSRHRPRSVRAKGSARVCCRGRARPVAVLDRGRVDVPIARSILSVSRSRCSQTARCSSSRGNTNAKSPISRYVRIGRVTLGAIARKASSIRRHVLHKEQRAVVAARQASAEALPCCWPTHFVIR